MALPANRGIAGNTVWIVIYIPDWDEFKTIVDSVYESCQSAVDRAAELNADPKIKFSAQVIVYKIKE